MIHFDSHCNIRVTRYMKSTNCYLNYYLMLSLPLLERITFNHVVHRYIHSVTEWNRLLTFDALVCSRGAGQSIAIIMAFEGESRN